MYEVCVTLNGERSFRWGVELENSLSGLKLVSGPSCRQPRQRTAPVQVRQPQNSVYNCQSLKLMSSAWISIHAAHQTPFKKRHVLKSTLGNTDQCWLRGLGCFSADQTPFKKRHILRYLNQWQRLMPASWRLVMPMTFSTVLFTHCTKLHLNSSHF